MKKLMILLMLTGFSLAAHAQEKEWKNWEQFKVDKTYVKFKTGDSKSPDGQQINFIYLAERLKDGVYDVTLERVSENV